MWDDITLIRSDQSYKDMFLSFVDATSLGDRDYELEPLRNKIIFAFINKIHEYKTKEKEKKIKKIVDFINNWNNKLKEIKKKNILEDKLNELYNEFEEIF